MIHSTSKKSFRNRGERFMPDLMQDNLDRNMGSALASTAIIKQHNDTGNTSKDEQASKSCSPEDPPPRYSTCVAYPPTYGMALTVREQPGHHLDDRRTPPSMDPLVAATYHNLHRSDLHRLPDKVLGRIISLLDGCSVECLRRTSRKFPSLCAPSSQMIPTGNKSG